MSKSTQTKDAPTSREQLQQEIQQTVRDAQIAAQKAAQEGGGARGGRGIYIPLPPGTPAGPGTTIMNPNDMIPQRAQNISIAFFVTLAVIIIGLPLMRAIARRIDRGAPQPVQFPNELKEQINHLTQSVDAIAIEVERISEGQRFTTKMLADRTREGTVLTPGARQ